MSSRAHVVVFGAGPAGLAAADHLARSGVRVTVLEQRDAAGGLASTREMNGHRYDLGGHRFFTKDPLLVELVEGLLGEDLLRPVRVSRIYRDGRFYRYPMKIPDALSQLGPFRAGRVLTDWLWAKARYAARKPSNFEEWVVKRFGRSLYRLYFEQYTRKVWGLEPAEISADWAAQRIRDLSVTRALLGALRPGRTGVRSLASSFLYPRLGMGMVCERLAERTVSNGGKLIFGAEVAGLATEPGRVRAVRFLREGREEEMEADFFFSTVPIDRLTLGMNPSAEVADAAGRLTYRDIRLLVITLNRERVTEDSWLYFPGPDVPFERWHEPSNWSPDMAPQGRTHLVIEHFCNAGDETWKMKPQALYDRTAPAAARIGGFGLSEVDGRDTVRVRRAYPVYLAGYEKPLRLVKGWLESFANLRLLGRNGRFRYNNTDHSLLTGLLAAKGVVEGRKYDLDAPGSEEAWYEEASP